LASVERALAAIPNRSAQRRADDAYRSATSEPMDTATDRRAIELSLLAGRSHYERIISAVLAAHTSVWIATANVKGLLVEGGAQVGRRRARGRGSYVSVLSLLDGLAARGVELRMLHADLPSRPFRDELADHPRLLAGGLALARCPRVHMKAVIVDGALLYIGSANWTGAGLGAKGSGKRNFELGIVTDDSLLLDHTQSLFDRVWSGQECRGCQLRAVCPGPLDEQRAPAGPPPTARRRTRKSP
jgi:phosphatidylserine/phosphatidylglycerophosphate/cardiolipin synthase-like enzyme